jgi:putative membrane protein
MKQRQVHRRSRHYAMAAVAAALMVNAVGARAHAQSAEAPAAAPLSTDDFVQAVATLSMFSQRAGKLGQIMGQNNDVRRYARDLADDQKPLQTLNQGLTAARIDMPTIIALPANQANLLQTLDRVDIGDFDRMFTDLQVQAQQTALAVVLAYAQSGDNPAVKALAAKLAPIFQQRLAQARSMQKVTG